MSNVADSVDPKAHRRAFRSQLLTTVSDINNGVGNSGDGKCCDGNSQFGNTPG